MNRRIRRSAASALRISLISGCGALGWLALSAGAATANDDGGQQSLLGSVSSVVESVATPVKSVVEEVSAPLAPTVEAVVPVSSQPVEKRSVENLPAVSDLISSVPELVDDLSVSETVAPITNAVDSTVSRVPIVNEALPQGTATNITRPVLETVDSTVAPVLQPVQHVVKPVVEVLDPVVETLDPVVEVVDPIVKPIVDPVVEVVDPIVKPIVDPVVEVVDPIVEPIVDSAPPVVSQPGPVGVVRPDLPDFVPAPVGTVESPAVDFNEAGGAESAVVTQDDGAADATASIAENNESPSVNERVLGAMTASSGPVRLADEPSAQAVVPPASSHDGPLQGARHQVEEAPQLALAAPQPTADPFASPVSYSGTSSASAGSSASGGMGAADTPSFFGFDLSSTVSLQSGYSAALPQGPTFDPGSTPD